MGEFASSLGCFCYVAAHLRRRRRLFFDSAGDRVRDVANLGNNLTDLANRIHRAAGVSLNRFDLVADIFRGLGSFLGQFLHLVGDHRKTLARFAGSGRFDRGIKSEQVRLFGDRRDHLDDLGDFCTAIAELRDCRVGSSSRGDRLLGQQLMEKADIDADCCITRAAGRFVGK